EQFPGLGAGGQMEPGAHEFLAQGQDQDQGQDRLQAGQQQRLAQAGALGQGGHEDDQGSHRQVLKQQDAQDQLAMLAVQFAAFGQQLADDGGGGHGQGSAQGQAGLPGKLQHHAQDHDDEHG